jgi:DNA-binding Xre family transcriptional regulator
MITNRVPELLAEKFGGKDKINLTQIQLETGMPYTSVSAWAKGKVERYDNKALSAWCKYLGVQPGDILVYEPDTE